MIIVCPHCDVEYDTEECPSCAAREESDVTDRDALAEKLIAKAIQVRCRRAQYDNPESYLLVILKNLVKDVYRKRKARGA